MEENLREMIAEERMKVPIITFDMTAYNDDYRSKYSQFDCYYFYKRREAMRDDEEESKNINHSEQKIKSANCYFVIDRTRIEGNESADKSYYAIALLVMTESSSFHYQMSYYIGYKKDNYAILFGTLFVLRKLRDLGITKAGLTWDKSFLERFCQGVYDAIDPYHMRVCIELENIIKEFQHLSIIPDSPGSKKYREYVQGLCAKRIEKAKQTKMINEAKYASDKTANGPLKL